MMKLYTVFSPQIWNHPDIYYQEVVAQGGKDPSHTRMLDEAGLPKPATSGLKVGGESSCKIDWVRVILSTLLLS